MNVHQSAITLVAALVVMDGNFQQVSAKAQANHCGDHIGFGPAPCLDTNIVANEFTAFMHNECVNGASPTLCDQYNPVWGQVHSSYQSSGDTGCDLSTCTELLYVHPVFDTFDEGSTEHKITSFTHCKEDECALDASDAAAALSCWNIFSSCFPNKIDDYHVVVEPGTTFDDASKLSEYYIYTSLPFAGSKAKDPKCDACTECSDACQTSMTTTTDTIDQSYDTEEEEKDEDEYLSSSSSSFVKYTHYSFMVTVAAAVYGYQYYA